MATLRADFGDLLEPGFREIFDEKFSDIPQVFPSIFHVNTSSKQDEKDSAVTGFGYLTQTPEGGAIDYDDPIQMYDVSYTHLKWTKGFKISEEMYEDDLTNIMNRKPAKLARAARLTTENRAARLIRRGFTDATGGDAKNLFDNDHPRADGGTAQSNCSTSGIVLSEPSLETAQLAVRQVLDDRGMLIAMKADTLLVPPTLEKKAREICDSTLRSGTADNDLNVFRGRFKIVVWDYLDDTVSGGSSTAWYLLDSSEHELHWFWRVKPEFKQDNAFDTGFALYKVRTRFSRGHSDWRGIWGSKGDSSSYTGA